MVGKTFRDVFSHGKDVFLEFYASWCAHCKKLVPVYDDLGKHFKDNDDVIIAKIDAAANDVPDHRFKVEPVTSSHAIPPFLHRSKGSPH